MALLSKKDTDGADEMAADFHFPSSKNALIIFVRNPELGKCKTRLARTIGEEKALEIYKQLLQHTASIAKDIKADRYVFYSEHIKRDDLWDTRIFRKKLQQGNDLGERMYNAFTEVLGMGYQKAIIIGSDLLDLDADLANNAYSQLDHHDVVLGPATDGGYYLLGLKKLYPKVFRHKEWGTSSVAKATLKDLENCNVHLLKELNDIDTFEDLQHYEHFKNLTRKHD